jgi:hypothetical protein
MLSFDTRYWLLDTWNIDTVFQVSSDQYQVTSIKYLFTQ